jgi:hypothetical protein
MKFARIHTWVVLCLLFAGSCTDSKRSKADLKTDSDKTQELINTNLVKLDSLTGEMENTDSFTLERFGSSVNTKDSLYKVLDSLLRRKNVLDSLLETK